MCIAPETKAYTDRVLDGCRFCIFCQDLGAQVIDDTEETVKQPEYGEIMQAVYETV